MSNYRVAIVYLGPELPRYVISNLKYITKTFSELPLVFITDNAASRRKINRLGIETWLSGPLDDYRDAIEIKSAHPKNFRNGFWFNTTGRFKAIENYIAQTGLSVLQIEADVWLSATFPFEYFPGLEKIAFPLESTNTGAASVLWVPNLASAKLLTNFSLDELGADSHATDMTILGSLAERHGSKVQILRSIPGDKQGNFDFSERDIGLFDPITYGIYFFGEDGRNNRGMRILYRQPTRHLVRADQSTLNYENGILTATFHGVTEELYCLHNHSKDIRLFKDPKRVIVKRLSENQHNAKRELVIFDFIKVVIASMSRRLSKPIE